MGATATREEGHYHYRATAPDGTVVKFDRTRGYDWVVIFTTGDRWQLAAPTNSHHHAMLQAEKVVGVQARLGHTAEAHVLRVRHLG